MGTDAISGVGGALEVPFPTARDGDGIRNLGFERVDSAELDLARDALRPRFLELCEAAIQFAIAGGRNAAAYVKFVADLFRVNQTSINVQILIAERLGVPLEEAKRAVDAVQAVPETLDGIEAMNCRFLAWVVRQHPERTAGIRSAIFGEVPEAGA